MENMIKAGILMSDAQREALDKLIKEQQVAASKWLHYWQEYSAFDTWQFWLHVIMLVAPLIVLYFSMDWKRALQLGFYGFNVHVWFGYIDVFGTTQTFWIYSYKMVPFIPNSVG